MLNIFTRTPTPEPFPTYADAEQYRAAGYEVIPVELSRATAGHETPMQGPWGFGVPASSVGLPAHNVPAILGCRLPWKNSHVSLDELRTRWLAFVRLDIHNNPKIARAAEAIVRSHVDTGPVRLTQGSTALLLPFRVADVRVAGMGEDSHKYTLDSGFIGAPGDKFACSRVTVSAPGACFIADGGPYSYRAGLGLLQLPYAELPALSVMQAVGIVTECRDLLESLKPKPAPTALQLRLEAARKRAQHQLDTVEVN
jgi:hypothetical protein